MKDFNKINSPEEQESQLTGWEDVEDFAPKKQKNIYEIRDKFNSAYTEQAKVESAKRNIDNIYDSMNRGETAKDRLALYRELGEKSGFGDNYEKSAEFYKERAKEYDDKLKIFSDRKEYLENEEGYLNYRYRSPMKKFFDKIRFGFSEERELKHYKIDKDNTFFNNPDTFLLMGEKETIENLDKSIDAFKTAQEDMIMESKENLDKAHNRRLSRGMYEANVSINRDHRGTRNKIDKSIARHQRKINKRK